MSFEFEKDGDRRRKVDQSDEAETPSKPRAKQKKSRQPEIGSALRSVYQRTVNEDIPPEMLDLLGKLG